LIFNCKETLCAWQKINRSSPNTKKQVLNEIVWHNHHIKIEGYSIYYKKLHDAGLTKIEDFFQGNRFLTFEEFCSKFKIKRNFLNYYGQCHVVPQKWINILKGNVTEPLEKCSEKDKISLDKFSCRSATKFFVKSEFVTLTVERRMKEASLKGHTTQLIYSLPFNVTKDTRLTIFQYKIIHHILPKNSALFRDSVKEHNKCHLCGERQTLTHLFESTAGGP